MLLMNEALLADVLNKKLTLQGNNLADNKSYKVMREKRGNDAQMPSFVTGAAVFSLSFSLSKDHCI